MSERPDAPTAARAGGQVAIALTVALLGFLLATQLRAQQSLADRLAIEREADLGQILSELTARSDQLQAEIIDLQSRLASRAGSQRQERALIRDARDRLQALQILLGLVPVRGKGIVMAIDDAAAGVGPEVLLDAVQELRDAGAEAIEINGRRVVVSTSFSGRPGALTIDRLAVASPYTIEAIGDPSTLAEAMRIPGGVVDVARARDASVRIRERSSVHIQSVARAPTFRHARPRR